MTCQYRHEFQCIYGQYFGFDILENINCNDHVENEIVQYYLKNYNEKTEEIIKMVRNFMLEDEDFKDIVGGLKLINLDALERLKETLGDHLCYFFCSIL